MISLLKHLFYLFIILLSKPIVTNTDKNINFQNFYINNKDKLSIDIDKFLPPGKFLNDLQIDFSENLNLEIPRNYNKEIFDDSINISVLENFEFLTSYDKYVSFLFRDEKGDLMIQLKTINFEDFKIESEFYYFGSSDLDCGKIVMNEKNIFGSCISKFDKTIKLCFHNYINNFVSVCQEFDLGIENEEIDLSFETPKMDIFAYDNLKKNFFVFFFKNSNFILLQNLFILFDGEQNVKFHLGKEVKIKKIRILNFNNLTKVVILLVMVELNGINELRYYKIIDFKFANENSSFKLIKQGITNFIYQNNSLVILKKNEDNLEFYDVNLNDLSWEVFYLEKEKRIKKFFLSNNFIIFETINKENNFDIFIFDLNNKRFFRIDDLERKTASRDSLRRSTTFSLKEINKIVNEDLNLVLVQFGDKSFFFEFQKGSTFCFELNRFQYINVSTKNLKRIKFDGKIKFEIYDKFYFFNIFFENFSMLKKNNFQKNIVLNTHDNFNEIKLNLYRNNMTFGKNDPINYLNEIKFNYDRDKDICNILNSFITNTSYVKICVENEIWIYKSFNFDDDKKTISFENKSVLKFNYNLSKIKMFKIFFNKFLFLITEEMEIIYFNIKSNKIEIKKNDFLQSFSDCFYEKNHIIFEKKKENEIYTIIEIQYRIKDIKFLLKKTIKLENIILKSLIIPTNKPEDLTYLRYSQRTKGMVHLETLKNKTPKKIISNFNFKSTLLIEVGYQRYIGLKKMDYGGFDLISIINKNLIYFPRSIINQINSIIDFSVVKGTNIFSLLYKTYENKYRLFIGRCALNIYQRVIQDFEISNRKIVQPKVTSVFLDDDRIVFNVFGLGVRFVKFFVFYLNGPFFIIDNRKFIRKASFTVNKESLSFNIEKIDFFKPKIQTKEIVLKSSDSKQDYLIYNLENEKNFKNLGNLINVDFIKGKNQKKIKFHPRLIFDHSKKIGYNKKGYKTKSKFSFKETKNSFSLFVNNFLYINSITQQNYDYHGCKFVHSRLDDQMDIGEIYICKNNKSNLIEITNFKDFNIKLKEYIKSFYRVQLVQVKEFIFIAFINNRYKGIDLWKFGYNKKINKETFILKKTFFSNDFLLKESYIKYFYMFEKKKNKTITFFITNYFDNNFVIRELGIDSNNFLTKNNKVLFNYKKEIINKIFCKHLKKKFTCLINSQNLIYDLNIQEKKDNWKLSINSIYQLPKSIMSTKKLSFNLSEKYVGVLFPPSEKNDLFIFLRNKKKIIENQDKIFPRKVYSGLKTPNESVFKELIFKENENGEDFLLVAGLNSPKKGYNFIYEEIFVNFYKIDEMKLTIKMDELDYKQKLHFRASFLNGHYQNFSIRLIDKHNMMAYVLIIVLSFLICVFLVLFLINFFIYKKNKILFEENKFFTGNLNFMVQTN